VATQQASQPSQLGIPVRSALLKHRRWQLSLGRWLNVQERYSLTFSYDLLNELNLWGIKLQPTISGVFLCRESFMEEEGMYGMLEVHRKWSSAEGNFRASLYSGAGLNFCFQTHDEWDEGMEAGGISLIFQAGAQARAKLLPILPALVGDFSIVFMPNYDPSIIVSFGTQGSFLKLASIWGPILLLLPAVMD